MLRPQKQQGPNIKIPAALLNYERPERHHIIIYKSERSQMLPINSFENTITLFSSSSGNKTSFENKIEEGSGGHYFWQKKT